MGPGAAFISELELQNSPSECLSLQLPQSQWLSYQTMVAPLQCFPTRHQTVQSREEPCSMQTNPQAGTIWVFSVSTRMGSVSRPTWDTIKEQTLL